MKKIMLSDASLTTNLKLMKYNVVSVICWNFPRFLHCNYRLCNDQLFSPTLRNLGTKFRELIVNSWLPWFGKSKTKLLWLKITERTERNRSCVSNRKATKHNFLQYQGYFEGQKIVTSGQEVRESIWPE